MLTPVTEHVTGAVALTHSLILSVFFKQRSSMRDEETSNLQQKVATLTDNPLKPKVLDSWNEGSGQALGHLKQEEKANSKFYHNCVAQFS